MSPRSHRRHRVYHPPHNSSASKARKNGPSGKLSNAIVGQTYSCRRWATQTYISDRLLSPSKTPAGRAVKAFSRKVLPQTHRFNNSCQAKNNARESRLVFRVLYISRRYVNDTRKLLPDKTEPVCISTYASLQRKSTCTAAKAHTYRIKMVPSPSNTPAGSVVSALSRRTLPGTCRFKNIGFAKNNLPRGDVGQC